MAQVLITGCSTGIGRETAIELTRRGHEVIATARRVETLDDLDVFARLHLDVTDEQSILDTVTAAGEIDVVVNNAGWATVGPVERMPIVEIRRMFEVNFFGVIRMVQAFAPRMRERGHGTFVNVSSVAGRVSAPLSGFYSGSKHALEALSDAMHYELGHFGIRTIVIEPGAVDTPFGANELHSGEDTPPYDELRRQWDSIGDSLRSGNPPLDPALVAGVIADAIDDPGAARRIPVGDDADLAIATHRSLDDATFESTMREMLDLTW